jgi:large subunit ribosomal protein L17
MRHKCLDKKLGRSGSHRKALVNSLVKALITERRVSTTLPKAKIARGAAEKMVTLARKDNVAARRLAFSRLGCRDTVKTLFETIAPAFADRPGGYTRIIKKGARRGDGAQTALLEWVSLDIPDKRKKKKKDGKETADAKE